MLDVTPQIIAVEMHLWQAGQACKRFGDCGLAGAGMPGEKENVAAEIVCHGHVSVSEAARSIVDRLLSISVV
ncbi:hypothetical protein D3C86_2173940 [compost metagenome]